MNFGDLIMSLGCCGSFYVGMSVPQLRLTPIEESRSTNQLSVDIRCKFVAHPTYGAHKYTLGFSIS